MPEEERKEQDDEEEEEKEASRNSLEPNESFEDDVEPYIQCG